MGCFSCGKDFPKTALDLIRSYKKEFEQKGISRYVYRLKSGGNLVTVKSEYFEEIYQKEIRPNLSQGAEYMHISEFTGA